VVAQIMGHAKVDTTINVYTQVLDGATRAAADRVGSELFTIVHNPAGSTALIPLKRLAHQPGQVSQLAHP
jgi:hypothetical protein